jgi:hypothetical protein
MFCIGLDLGQRRDHSALAVVEKRHTVTHVRHLERVALGTPYPLVVERVGEVVRRAYSFGPCCLVVDATGVGAPVVDLLRQAQLGCELMPVTITGGEKESAGSVPKRDLIAGLQVAMERRELRVAPGLKESGALIRELMDVRLGSTPSGRLRMGADGFGEHDDLVIALALACWRARRRTIGFGDKRLL